jgi:hypothetical protein
VRRERDGWNRVRAPGSGVARGLESEWTRQLETVDAMSAETKTRRETDGDLKRKGESTVGREWPKDWPRTGAGPGTGPRAGALMEC